MEIKKGERVSDGEEGGREKERERSHKMLSLSSCIILMLPDIYQMSKMLKKIMFSTFALS